MATPTRAAAPGVNFGDPGMYVASVFIGDGDYVVFFDVMMHQATDKTTGATRGPNLLGVMVKFYPKDNATEEAKLEKFYSMGSKAHESFAPNPETGKGVVPIPGAKGQTFNDKTNWALLHKSFYDSGLPAGIFTNDISVLDGSWVHITNVDEPAERSSFQSATSEIPQDRKPGKIPVVTEFLEGGMPWEGGGGIPESAPAKPAAKTTPARTAPKPPARPAAAPAAAAGVDEQDVRGAAIACMSDVIEKKPNGMPRVAFKTDTFKLVKSKYNEEMAGAVATMFLEDSEALAAVVGELGYKFGGAGNAQVIPA